MLRLHVLAFGVWWWVMPGGFPVSDLKAWSNVILPVMGVAAAALAVWAGWRDRRKLRVWLLMAFAWGWLISAETARQEFPISCRLLCAGPFAAAVLMALLVFLEARRPRLKWTPVFSATPLLAGICGHVFVRAQLAGVPTTKPLGMGFVDAPEQESLDSASIVRLGGFIDIHPASGSIEIENESRVLTVSPLLTFRSRSPDGFWTLFAGTHEREGPTRQLLGRGAVAGKLSLRYSDDGESIIRVAELGGVEIDARSNLPKIVWSHLNTFATLTCRGESPVSVSFSPCPGHRIQAKPIHAGSDRVAEFAYVDASDVFHIVASRNEEKGPFTETASGSLGTTDPLLVTFFEGDRAFFRIMLKDWAAQSSRARSPTAGWGVPENAIELLTSDPATLEVFFTLAATSVGRGFESVGHSPGLYSNRMIVEPVR